MKIFGLIEKFKSLIGVRQSSAPTPGTNESAFYVDIDGNPKIIIDTADSEAAHHLAKSSAAGGEITLITPSSAATSYTLPTSGTTLETTSGSASAASSAVSSHSGTTTGVHGVGTGDVVGTDKVQVITSKDIDGGTASNANRITVPKNSTSNLAGLTRKEATLVYDSTTKKLNIDDGSALKVVGGGLVVTVLDAPATSGVNLEAGKHYIVTGLTADTTLNLPAGAAESALRVSVLNNATSGYRVTLARNGSDTIAYDSVTTYTDAKIMYADQWVELSWRSTYWVIDDASSPLNGTFSGALTVTGALTASAGIILGNETLSVYDEYSVTANSSGAMAVSYTATIVKIGKSVTFNITTIQSSPAAAADLIYLLGVIPAGLRPVEDKYFIARVANQGVSQAGIVLCQASTGNIAIYADTAGSNYGTSAGLSGLYATTWSWTTA
jgi:hypothetical protein